MKSEKLSVLVLLVEIAAIVLIHASHPDHTHNNGDIANKTKVIPAKQENKNAGISVSLVSWK